MKGLLKKKGARLPQRELSQDKLLPQISQTFALVQSNCKVGKVGGHKVLLSFYIMLFWEFNIFLILFCWEEASSNRQSPYERREHILAQTDSLIHFPFLLHRIMTCIVLYDGFDGECEVWGRKRRGLRG